MCQFFTLYIFWPPIRISAWLFCRFSQKTSPGILYKDLESYFMTTLSCSYNVMSVFDVISFKSLKALADLIKLFTCLVTNFDLHV